MKRLFDYIREKLSVRYEASECESISYLIFENILGYNRLQVHLHKDDPVQEAKVTEIEEILNRLLNGEPIQYILGEADFYGLKFAVNPSVLIPRQETEELVDWILRENQLTSPRILDIGTGSGCIPVSLSKHLPKAMVLACDISEDALDIAKQNARRNEVEIHFWQLDILHWETHPIDKTFDIIVSNPPYVKEEEQSQIQEHVLHHEPHLALFVKNDDPLIFYRHIADFALKYLSPEGKLYFEINENLGNETVSLLKAKGFSKVSIRKDINGKDRMISATR